MKEYEEIAVKETRDVPKSITCNKCGKHKELSGEDYEREWQSNEFQTFYCSFGYGSKFDMDRWAFDLCEKCLIDFIRTFKHLPEDYDEGYANKVYDKL